MRRDNIDTWPLGMVRYLIRNRRFQRLHVLLYKLQMTVREQSVSRLYLPMNCDQWLLWVEHGTVLILLFLHKEPRGTILIECIR